MTLSCGCERVETVTRCVRSCDGGCWTDWAVSLPIFSFFWGGGLRERRAGRDVNRWGDELDC